MFHIRELKKYLNVCSMHASKICLSYTVYYLYDTVAVATIIRVPSQEC
jgi:hypothetical protein